MNILFYIGASLLFVGAALKMWLGDVASYIYCLGAVLFGLMQFLQRYKGDGLVLKRLTRQQLLGVAFLLGTGAAMFFCKHNEWIAFLSIGALFELYTAFRISHELDKEKQK